MSKREKTIEENPELIKISEEFIEKKRTDCFEI